MGEDPAICGPVMPPFPGGGCRRVDAKGGVLLACLIDHVGKITFTPDYFYPPLEPA